MPIDPSIPLSSAQLNPLQTAQLAGQRLQLQQGRQQIADQNALRTLFAAPGAVDAQGMPTQNTLARLTQMNPEEAMKLRGQMLDLQLGKAGLSEKQWKAGVDAAAGAKQLYDQQIDQGVSPAQAQRNAQVLYSQNMKQLAQSGLLSPDQIAMLQPTFDPQRVASNMDMLKFREQRRENQQRIGMEGARLGMERQFHNDELGLQRDRLKWEIDSGRGDKQQVLMDPVNKDAAGNPTPYIYDMTKHKAFTLGGEPYTPGGAAKMANGSASGTLTPEQDAEAKTMGHQMATYKIGLPSGFSAKSPFYARAMQYALQENPEIDAAQYPARQKAVSAFSTGKQGDTVRFLNTSISHLDTLQQAADALSTGNVRALNALTNSFQREFGVAAPTNFETAKNIVGQEIVKAITGSSAAESDRQAAQNAFDKANSPEALVGAIHVVKALLGGQMRSLRKQYEDTTRLKNFDERLTPEAKAALETGDRPAQGAAQSADRAAPADAAAAAPEPLPMVTQDGKQVPDASKLKDGRTYTLPDGRRAKFDEKRMGFSVVQN